jgi:hypothetical protein
MEAEVAQKEYWARSFGYYLRREPYLPLMRTYMQEIAAKYDVPLRTVMALRRTYVKKHPLNWQKKMTRKARKYA